LLRVWRSSHSWDDSAVRIPSVWQLAFPAGLTLLNCHPAVPLSVGIDSLVGPLAFMLPVWPSRHTAGCDLPVILPTVNQSAVTIPSYCSLLIIWLWLAHHPAVCHAVGVDLTVRPWLWVLLKFLSGWPVCKGHADFKATVWKLIFDSIRANLFRKKLRKSWSWNKRKIKKLKWLREKEFPKS
jgi:hypothetical protein